MTFLAILWTHLLIILLHFAFISLIFFVLYRIGRYLFTRIRALMTANGIGVLASFLAAGVGVVLFYNTFSILLVNSGEFIMSLFEGLAEYLNETDGDGNHISKFSETVYTAFKTKILTIPFVKLVIFSVVWVFAALLLQSVMKNDQSDSSDQVFNLFSTVQWRYTVFGVLIICGIFMSIASIIAVPIFQEDENNTDSEMLNIGSQLEGYLPDSTVFFKKYELVLDPTEETALGVSAMGQVDNWNDLVSSTYINIHQQKERVIGRFNTAKEEKLTRDAKLDYMNELAEWFLDTKTALVHNLNNNRPVVNTWVTDTYTFMLNKDSVATANAPKLLDKSTMIIPGSTVKPLPALPNVSVGYGIFGWLAGWILKANNLSFALIAGMVGFGIFGATISHIVLETTDAVDTSNFSAVDYLKLLVRGFSAAIVIYLAVKGGLLVVSGSESGINAYFIFFFCFVAAVFSELIWNWVKEKLVSSLNQNKS